MTCPMTCQPPRRPTSAVAAIAALSLATLAASPAAAQDSGQPATLFGWSLGNARIGVVAQPDYLGSDDYRLSPSGSLSLTRHPGALHRFGAPDDGFSLGLVGDATLSAGLVGRWRSGRDNSHDLRGFDKVDGTVEVGGYVNWWPAEGLRVRAEVRHGVGGHDSLAADLGADAVAHTGPWVLSVGPRLSWAEDRFTRTYFDVTPADAARSPFALQPYAARGSFWSPGALASAEYRLARSWSVTAVGGYRRLTGDASDSPIVARLGSKDQVSASLGVRYAFGP